MSKKKIEKIQKKNAYSGLLWLFALGSLLGVVLEGNFCLVRYGRWETHVVSVWGPFCILYGFGIVGFYLCSTILKQKKWWVQFLIYCGVGFAIELICGCILEFGLRMRAWDYSEHFMNIRGHVSLKMTIVWGIAGIGFSKIAPYIDKLLKKTEKRVWKNLSLVFTVFMLVNLIVTTAAVVRWKERHINVPAKNRFERLLDEKYNDSFMAERFCEWRFLE